MGASDLVQETLLQAQQIIGRFEGTSEHQLRLWLRQILLHRAAHATRSYRGTGKRDIRLEQPAQLVAGNSAWDELADAGPSPEGGTPVAERAAAIERALENLPASYREVIVMRCFERQTFVQIGKQLEMSADAAPRRGAEALTGSAANGKPTMGPAEKNCQPDDFSQAYDALLIALDEAIAEGATRPSVDETPFSAELAAQAREAQECLELLEEVRHARLSRSARPAVAVSTAQMQRPRPRAAGLAA